MRKKGHSILDLMKMFSLPKTTVWYHTQSIKLTRIQKNILRSRQGGSAKYREIRWSQAKEDAKKLLCGKNRELGIVLAMLYWAEGHKRNSCAFTNSDGRMISIYLYILRNVFSVKDDSILPAVRIFSGMSRSQCLNYWANITRIPKSKIIVRFNDGGTRGRTPYGMCRIILRKGNQQLKLIHSLIDQVFLETVR